MAIFHSADVKNTVNPIASKRQRKSWRVGRTIALVGLLSLGWTWAAVAQQSTLLTAAEVYRLRNSVQLLPRNQSPRAARLADRMRPLDALRTARAAVAELKFNEGSIARVDQNTTFRFETGLRRFRLPNRVAMNETTFVLEGGTALILSPPNSVGTQVRTPNSVINIRATGRVSVLPKQPAAGAIASQSANQVSLKSSAASTHRVCSNLTTCSVYAMQLAQEEELLPPPEGSSAVMVTVDPVRRLTQVFALTDDDITVSDANGEQTVALRGGQTVAVIQDDVGQIEEFDLQTFYSNVALAAGLAPGQEDAIAQDPPDVQASINAVRPELVTAIENQERRQAGFTATFLRDALSGRDSDFDGRRGQPAVTIINPSVTLGTFVRTGENTANFIPSGGGRTVPISVDFDTRSIQIGNQSGISNSAGLSGENASGTVILENGRIIRIDVFGIGGREPRENVPYSGSLTTGTVPDR